MSVDTAIVEAYDIGVEHITPDMARHYLGMDRVLTNEEARQLKSEQRARYTPSLEKRLVASIMAGEWKLNGETIVLDELDLVLDGQHRLRAIIKSGKTLPSYVVHGMDRDVFDTLDQGGIRTNPQMIGIRAARGEVPNWTKSERQSISGAATLYLENQTDQPHGTPTRIQTQEFVMERAEDWSRSLRFLTQQDRARLRIIGINPAVLLYTHFAISEIQSNPRKLVEEFYREFLIGISDKAGNVPALALRAVFDNVRMNRSANARMTRQRQVRFIFKAWNVQREGKELKVLRLTSKELSKFEGPR